MEKLFYLALGLALSGALATPYDDHVRLCRPLKGASSACLVRALVGSSEMTELNKPGDGSQDKRPSPVAFAVHVITDASFCLEEKFRELSMDTICRTGKGSSRGALRVWSLTGEEEGHSLLSVPSSFLLLLKSCALIRRCREL
ncbi:hypothetical protein ISCGN_021138 [Ixodes scapularis]